MKKKKTLKKCLNNYLITEKEIGDKDYVNLETIKKPNTNEYSDDNKFRVIKEVDEDKEEENDGEEEQGIGVWSEGDEVKEIGDENRDQIIEDVDFMEDNNIDNNINAVNPNNEKSSSNEHLNENGEEMNLMNGQESNVNNPNEKKEIKDKNDLEKYINVEEYVNSQNNSCNINENNNDNNNKDKSLENIENKNEIINNEENKENTNNQNENNNNIPQVDFEVVLTRFERIWKPIISRGVVNSMMGIYVFEYDTLGWKKKCINFNTVEFMPQNEVSVKFSLKDVNPKGFIIMPVTYGEGIKGPFLIMAKCKTRFTFTQLEDNFE
jgi:hypothetical protein